MITTLVLAPEAVLVATGGATLLMSEPRRARTRARVHRWGPRAVVLALLVALGLELWLGAQVGTLFQGGFVQDRFALFAKAAVLLTLAVGVAAADWDLERLPGPLPAALLGGFGVMVAASASDLFAIWAGAALAVVAAASVLGSVRALTVSGALLMLVALCLAYVHASAGASAVDAVRSALADAPTTLPLALPLLIGLGGLIGLLVLAPFGFGPGPRSTPFGRGAAAGVGAAGAGVALLTLGGILAGAAVVWAPGLAAAAAGLVLLAGLGAAVAPRPRVALGLLAAAQLGWVAAAVATHAPGGLGAGLFLLGTAAVGAAAAPQQLAGRELVGGRGRRGAREPGRAAALAVAGLSLAAVPPLAGFFGVFLVAAALGAAGYWWALTLALLGWILAAVGAARFAFVVFLLEPEDARTPLRAPSTRVLPSTFGGAAAVMVTLVLIGYSIFANPISGLAGQAASALLAGR